MARKKEEPEQELFRASEFWQEEERAARREMGRQLVRWLAVFAVLFAFGCFVMWWAGQTVQYSSARTTSADAKAAWRVYGIVRDEETGEPVPFAKVADGPGGHPPRYEATADHLGHFELYTLPERHQVTAGALGYHPRTAKVGRDWYSWMPSGTERVDFLLRRERGR
jgi:hypothetical protein